VRRPLLPLALALAATLVAIGPPRPAEAARPSTTAVSIRGTSFLVNGRVTYRGTRVEGMLLNARLIQAAFDDANPSTVAGWRYPDTGRWSAERNTRELVAQIPVYARHGLRAVTIGMQGGSPRRADGFRGDDQRPNVSAFRSDGSLKPAWVRRLDRVIAACNRSGIVAIVSLFYFGQDHRLRDEAAVLRAVDATTDWLVRRRYRNVLVEIANEADLFYEHAILGPARIDELIARVQRRSRGRLKVSASFTSGHFPWNGTVRQADFVLVHGNGQNADGIKRIVEMVRSRDAFRAAPKPIVFNEDSTDLANMAAAIASRASWGYYDRGANDYRNGYQSPPVNWRINTPAKRRFFALVARLAGRRPGPA
jgi:hypothetical protein